MCHQQFSSRCGAGSISTADDSLSTPIISGHNQLHFPPIPRIRPRLPAVRFPQSSQFSPVRVMNPIQTVSMLILARNHIPPPPPPPPHPIFKARSPLLDLNRFIRQIDPMCYNNSSNRQTGRCRNIATTTTTTATTTTTLK